jgi:predicted phosphodiesterase
MKRLQQAYEQACRYPLNNQSKLIFFSDVHRGDNSISDEFAHNQNVYEYALDYYFSSGFTYVEVGDGDELWEHSRFKHIRRAHSVVYLKLKKYFDEGRLLMIFGNHNMDFKFKNYVKDHLYDFYDDYRDDFAPLFPGIVVHEAIVFEHQESQKEIFVVHGHQGDLINDQMWRITKFFNRHFWHYLHIVGFRNPASPAKNLHKRHKIEKNYTKWIKRYQKMLIVGHTHRPKFPSKADYPYFNTGSCIFPRNITGIEIENGYISLIDWRIRPDVSGNLSIKRQVIVGPELLTNYL